MTVEIQLTVNGKDVAVAVEERTLLSDLIRETLGLKGTHRGCDTAQCGACTVHLDGEAVKSCNVLAVRANGHSVTTIEGISIGGALHPMQAAFRDCHGLQCGFCTPGMVMSAIDLLRLHPNPDERLIREQLDGNLCRCTGYENIVKAVRQAASAGRE
jgi:aerobic carbon-monoxide dehydrogenase small subunit